MPLQECRKCHRMVYPDEMIGSICRDCQIEEWDREREREKHHQELLEQAERHHQEMLDATLPWLTCEACGNKERKDCVVQDSGKIYCSECGKRIRKCQFCQSNYVASPKGFRKVFYTRNEFFSKKTSEIEYGERSGLKPHTDPFTDNLKNLTDALNDFRMSNEEHTMSYKSYDDIRRFSFYMCPSCYSTSKENKEQWDESDKLKEEYDRLKVTKERNDREKEELERKKEELAKQKEQIRKREEKAENERREKEQKKRSEQKFSAGCFGAILLVAVLLVAYFNDINMAAAAIVGAVILVLSIILKSFTSRIFNGLIFGVVFTLIFGLIISGIYWFLRDAFLTPLTVCFVGSTILGTILDAVGVLDKIKERG